MQSIILIRLFRLIQMIIIIIIRRISFIYVNIRNELIKLFKYDEAIKCFDINRNKSIDFHIAENIKIKMYKLYHVNFSYEVKYLIRSIKSRLICKNYQFILEIRII